MAARERDETATKFSDFANSAQVLGSDGETRATHSNPLPTQSVVGTSLLPTATTISTTAGAIPATEVTDGTGSALNPTGWVVTPGDTIGVISPAACVLTLEFFA